MELTIKEYRKHSPYRYLNPFGEGVLLQEKQGMFVL